jgi:hypothetical protein
MYSEKVIQAIIDVRSASVPVDMQNFHVVVANLVFMHQVIAASESLMIEAQKVADGPLLDYLTAHLAEEQGHEAWLAQDLSDYGIDVSVVPKFRKAVAMAGSQYYLIKHSSPYALLGYMAVLEGFPVSLASVEALEAAHGKELFRTLRYHAEHDLEHRKELFSFINAHPKPEVLSSAIETARYMNELSEDLQSGVLWDLIKDSQ